MKNMLKKENPRLPAGRQGFTIIEVMIVLAIAALILLVVFLAVPALQRSQRNNARKTDVSRFAAAIITFVTNNNNALPTVTADVTTIISDVGSTGGYPPVTVAGTLGTAANGKVSLVAGAQGALSTSLVDSLQIVTGAICGSGGATTADTAKKVALQYTLETSTAGTSTVYCQNVQ